MEQYRSTFLSTIENCNSTLQQIEQLIAKSKLITKNSGRGMVVEKIVWRFKDQEVKDDKAPLRFI